MSASVEPPTAQGFFRRHAVKLVVSIVIAGAFSWTLHRVGLPLLPPKEAMAQVSVGSCIIYVALLITMHTFRATRWRHLLQPLGNVPLRRVVAVSFIGFAAILLIPVP